MTIEEFYVEFEKTCNTSSWYEFSLRFAEAYSQAENARLKQELADEYAADVEIQKIAELNEQDLRTAQAENERLRSVLINLVRAVKNHDNLVDEGIASEHPAMLDAEAALRPEQRKDGENG